MRKKIKIKDPRLTIAANNACCSTLTKGCSGGCFIAYDSDEITDGYYVSYINGRRVYCEEEDCLQYWDTDEFVAEEDHDKVEEKYIKYPKKELDRLHGDNYGRIHCYWCGTKLQKRYTKNTYYCRKCKK